jgi:hypothetical protein
MGCTVLGFGLIPFFISYPSVILSVIIWGILPEINSGKAA